MTTKLQGLEGLDEIQRGSQLHSMTYGPFDELPKRGQALECTISIRGHDEQLNHPEHPVLSVNRLIKRTALRLRRKQEQMRMLAERGPVSGTTWRTKPDRSESEELIGPLIVIID